MQDYIESLRSLPEARVQDLFQRKNLFAVIVRSFKLLKGIAFYPKRSELDDAKCCFSEIK